MTNPQPYQIRAARERIQAKRGLNITTAQGFCAAMVHVDRRTWQKWENGERAMHAAFWELFLIKSWSSRYD